MVCISARGPSGRVRLATAEIVRDRTGYLELALSDVRVVDANGRPLALRNPNATVGVTVVSGGRTFSAPRSRWRIPARGSGAAAGTDLSGDGVVSDADVRLVAEGWATERLTGATCSSNDADVDGDGCVDVADAQKIAAGYSAAGRRPTPAPGTGIGKANVGVSRPGINADITNQANQEGDSVSLDADASDPDGDTLTYTYQWTNNGNDIAGATGATHNLTGAGNGNRGDLIRVRVTASDGSLQSPPVTSGAVTVANTAPTATVALSPTSPGTNATAPRQPPRAMQTTTRSA